MTVQPLRIKMFRDMNYFSNNTGNIYQREKGGWAIRFKPEDFKNETGAAQKPYDVPLPDYLSKEIEFYINNIRPKLNNEDLHAFFLNSSFTKKSHNRKTTFLSTAILHRTRQFLPNCPGFSPHAFRHIVATDYIKNNPNGYQVAADVLHDKLSTVLAHYAHLKAADGHRFYQDYIKQMHEEWKNKL